MSLKPLDGKLGHVLGKALTEIVDQALDEMAGRFRPVSSGPAPDREPVFHSLDYLDVALSARSVARVRRAARRVAREHMPEARFADSGQALALFLDHVFWEEGSGRLYLCADLEGRGFYLPIPSGEWSLRPRNGPLQ